MRIVRHTCATLLPGRNVNPKIVSEMLGHASIAITLDTYSHVLPTMQSEAAKAMEDALSSRVGVVIGVEGASVRVLALCFALSFCTFAGISVCAGGGTRTHTRLPSPDFESALLRDRGRHGGTQGDKTALL